MKNKYGIIDLGLINAIILGNNFNTGSVTNITSALTDNQKQILREIHDKSFSKLVYVDITIVDDDGNELHYKGLLHINGTDLVIVGVSDSNIVSYVMLQWDGSETYNAIS